MVARKKGRNSKTLEKTAAEVTAASENLESLKDSITPQETTKEERKNSVVSVDNGGTKGEPTIMAMSPGASAVQMDGVDFYGDSSTVPPLDLHDGWDAWYSDGLSDAKANDDDKKKNSSLDPRITSLMIGTDMAEHLLPTIEDIGGGTIESEGQTQNRSDTSRINQSQIENGASSSSASTIDGQSNINSTTDGVTVMNSNEDSEAMDSVGDLMTFEDIAGQLPDRRKSVSAKKFHRNNSTSLNEKPNSSPTTTFANSNSGLLSLESLDTEKRDTSVMPNGSPSQNLNTSTNKTKDTTSSCASSGSKSGGSKSPVIVVRGLATNGLNMPNIPDTTSCGASSTSDEIPSNLSEIATATAGGLGSSDTSYLLTKELHKLKSENLSLQKEKKELKMQLYGGLAMGEEDLTELNLDGTMNGASFIEQIEDCKQKNYAGNLATEINQLEVETALSEMAKAANNNHLEAINSNLNSPRSSTADPRSSIISSIAPPMTKLSPLKQNPNIPNFGILYTEGSGGSSGSTYHPPPNTSIGTANHPTNFPRDEPMTSAFLTKNLNSLPIRSFNSREDDALSIGTSRSNASTSLSRKYYKTSMAKGKGTVSLRRKKKYAREEGTAGSLLNVMELSSSSAGPGGIGGAGGIGTNNISSILSSTSIGLALPVPEEPFKGADGGDGEDKFDTNSLASHSLNTINLGGRKPANNFSSHMSSLLSAGGGGSSAAAAGGGSGNPHQKSIRSGTPSVRSDGSGSVRTEKTGDEKMKTNEHYQRPVTGTVTGKIIVVGPCNAGKTSLINRLVSPKLSFCEVIIFGGNIVTFIPFLYDVS